MILEQLCTEIVDCTHKTAPVSRSGEYYAVGTPAMRGNVIDYAEAKRIDYLTFQKWTARLKPREGDLLLAREAPVGPVVRVPRSENVAPGQRTVLLRPDDALVDSRFLYYYLISPSMQSELMVKASGSTVPHLNVADVRILPTPGVPRRDEQIAIAQVLGVLDDKISANNRITQLTDALLSSKFRAMTAESRGWSALKCIADVNVAVTKPKDAGYLRYMDISAVGQGRLEMPGYLPWADAPERARRVIRYGDTVWSTVRPNRRSHALVLDSDPLLVASTGLAVLSPQSGRTASLYEATRTGDFVKYLESVAEGSAYPAVRGERFLDAPIPDFSDEEWDRFEKFALPMRERANSAATESRKLAAARDELLPLLMSGKLRVRDAEKAVEEVV